MAATSLRGAIIVILAIIVLQYRTVCQVMVHYSGDPNDKTQTS